MSATRILLLTCRIRIYKKNDYIRMGPPIGLAYLSSVLHSEDNKVFFIDVAAEGFSEREEIDDELLEVGINDSKLLKRIAKINPHIIGISLLQARDFSALINMVKLIKKNFPNIIIVLGGTHVSLDFYNVLLKTNADFLIVGEGEIIFTSLINFAKKQNYSVFKMYESGIPRIITKKFNSYFTYEMISKPTDPDWTIFKNINYDPSVFFTGCIRGKKAIDYFTSRGCPNHCKYCSTPIMWGKWRCVHNIEDIERHLDNLIMLGYDEIILHEDNIIYKPELAKSIFDMLHKKKLYWTLGGGIDRTFITYELLESIIENGCNRVHYAVESCNHKLLRKYKKYINISDDNLNITPNYIKILSKSGVEVFADFMIGFPGETISDLETTVEYAKYLKDCGAHFVEFCCVTPFPGTQFYNECLKDRMIIEPEKYEDYTLFKGNINTDYFSADFLTEFRLKSLEEVNGTEIFSFIRSHLNRPNFLKSDN